MSNKVILKRSSVAGKVPSSLSLDYGELALNYTDGKLYYKDSEDIVRNLVAGGVSNQSIYRETYIADEGDTTFVVQYTSPNVDVYVNGIKLKESDYIATSGTNVVLAEPCYQDDVVELIGFVNVAFTDFTVDGLGLSFDETTVKVTLESAVENVPNTVVYRDENGDFAAGEVTAESVTANTLQAPQIIVSGAYTLPTEDGALNNLITTDGAGTLSWVEPFQSQLITYTTDTSAHVIDGFSAEAWRSVEYFITTSSASGFGACKLLLLHDDTNVVFTISSMLGEGPGEFSATMTDGYVELFLTPVDASTEVRYIRTIIRNSGAYSV